MQNLAVTYPAFVTLTTTQEWFGLPRAGHESDCLFDKNYPVSGTGCNNYVLIIQDKAAYPEDPDVALDRDNVDHYLNLEESSSLGDNNNNHNSGWKHIPDVFLSGAVHGNERVGPTSLLEMTELLLGAAHCESLPRMRHKPSDDVASNNNNTTLSSENANPQKTQEEEDWKRELFDAQNCRLTLEGEGIHPHHRRWLARLVSSRRTIVIPTANALGYSRNQREEDAIDPNRDFPFDIRENEKEKCMQTVAGRSINELFRSHLFPVGLTFHGGMEVIAYEWGAPTYLDNDAPDAIAQNDIAGAYSRYAGGFSGHVAYDFGTMNDKVYYVRGGMEDWAFAGSWDPDRVVQCAPTTFGGYPAEKTTYNNSTLRAFNMLIETSTPKTPQRKDLGKRTNPLEGGDGGGNNGHIVRNLRLALLAVDVVEPYVSIRQVGGLDLEDDVVPGVNLRRYDGKGYFENGAIIWTPGVGEGKDIDGGDVRKMEDPSSSVTISWTVGGAFNIDETELIFGPWDSLPSNLADGNDGAYPSVQTLEVISNIDDFISVSPSNLDSTAGRSRWHVDGPHPTASSDDINPTFEVTIDTSAYPPGTNLAVFAKAKVDRQWLGPISENVAPSNMGPVSHIVNARGNPNYYATNAGKVIRGRQDDWWYSSPVTLVVGGAASEAEADQIFAEAETNHAPISFVSNESDGRMDEGGSRLVKAVHVNARIGYLPHVMDTVVSHPSNSAHSLFGGGGASTTKSMPFLLGTLGIAIFVLLVLVGLVRRRRKRNMYARQRLESIAEDEADSFSAGSYRDDPAMDGDVEVPAYGRAHVDDENEDLNEIDVIRKRRNRT